MRAPAVEVRGLTRRFGTFAALDHVTFAIPSGEFTVLLGPSGSGKATSLSIIGGFLLPDEGEVLIAGADVTGTPPASRPTATVSQNYVLFPHMSVLANVPFGLRMRGAPRRERVSRACEMLRLVGLEQVGEKRPHELSDGQRQRVALARSLAVSGPRPPRRESRLPPDPASAADGRGAGRRAARSLCRTRRHRGAGGRA
jgi:spermidine/putrescine transport system ATP-binding protein